jgi:hypothetical protein
MRWNGWMSATSSQAAFERAFFTPITEVEEGRESSFANATTFDSHWNTGPVESV